MSQYGVVLKHLITSDFIVEHSGEEIINEIALKLYKEENYHLTEAGGLSQVPTIIKDIILLINFDTELNMSGILGFLENSSGIFFEDTIETLKRINAKEDYEVFIEMKSIMEKYGVTTDDLNEDINQQTEYAISSFSETHGSQYDEMADRIEEASEKLYIEDSERNIFDSLIKYVDEKKASLIIELKNIND